MANCRKPNPKFEDKKLQEFLDGAHEGVVYVSFGSVLKASEMSPEKLKDLLKVRGCLAERFSSLHFVNLAINANDTRPRQIFLNYDVRNKKEVTKSLNKGTNN